MVPGLQADCGPISQCLFQFPDGCDHLDDAERQPLPVQPEPCPRSSRASPAAFPIGLEIPAQIPSIEREMVRRGYPDDAVTGILGYNWIDLFKRVLVNGEW